MINLLLIFSGLVIYLSPSIFRKMRDQYHLKINRQQETALENANANLKAIEHKYADLETAYESLKSCHNELIDFINSPESPIRLMEIGSNQYLQGLYRFDNKAAFCMHGNNLRNCARQLRRNKIYNL
jgi:hypothetical protein